MSNTKVVYSPKVQNPEAMKLEAIEILSKYEAAMTEAEFEPPLSKKVFWLLNLSYDDGNISRYRNLVLHALTIFADPLVSTKFTERMNELCYTDFIKILRNVIEFFEDINTKGNRAALLAESIDSGAYTDAELKHIIDEYSGKLEALKA